MVAAEEGRMSRVLSADVVVRIHGVHKPYVSLGEAEDHLRLGWMVLIPNDMRLSHPLSVHMVWPCSCKMVVPVK
jgi:hypothetical protein